MRSVLIIDVMRHDPQADYAGAVRMGAQEVRPAMIKKSGREIGRFKAVGRVGIIHSVDPSLCVRQRRYELCQWPARALRLDRTTESKKENYVEHRQPASDW